MCSVRGVCAASVKSAGRMPLIECRCSDCCVRTVMGPCFGQCLGAGSALASPWTDGQHDRQLRPRDPRQCAAGWHVPLCPGRHRRRLGGADRRRSRRGARRSGGPIAHGRRAAPPRHRRHPRAHQRAGPHRMGGLRHCHPRGRGRRCHHPHRHAAQLDPADHQRRRARGQAGCRGGGICGRRRILGRRRARLARHPRAAVGCGGLRLQGLPLPQRRRRVPAPVPRAAGPGARGDRRLRRSADRARRRSDGAGPIGKRGWRRTTRASSSRALPRPSSMPSDR